jgi:hypothetical protein
MVHRHELDEDPESPTVTPFICPVCGYDWAKRQADGNWVKRWFA